MSIPIFILSRDRLSCLKALVDWFEEREIREITIIDNASTFPPLVEYLHNSKHRVMSLNENLGHYALWRCGLFDNVINSSFYIYTDPDVVPIHDCPTDFVDKYIDILQRHDTIPKVGMGLMISDIPDHYPLKRNVLQWEKQYWIKEVKGEVNPKLYHAPIDTTLAVYRPKASEWGIGFRSDTPYVARHTTWYTDFNNLTEEDIYYKEHATDVSHWLTANSNLYMDRPWFEWEKQAVSGEGSNAVL